MPPLNNSALYRYFVSTRSGGSELRWLVATVLQVQRLESLARTMQQNAQVFAIDTKVTADLVLVAFFEKSCGCERWAGWTGPGALGSTKLLREKGGSLTPAGKNLKEVPESLPRRLRHLIGSHRGFIQAGILNCG